MTDRLDELKKANEQLEELQRDLRGAMEAQQERLKRAAEEQIRLRREATDREIGKLSHLPTIVASKIDFEAVQRAVSSGRKPDLHLVEIKKWDDGYGNTLFTSGDIGIGIGQISDLSISVASQRSVFQTLGADEQAQIRTAFQSTSPTTEVTNPYKDFLESEALEKRFHQLQLK